MVKIEGNAGGVYKVGQAGTLESNDAMITVAPGKAGSGVFIDLTSIVKEQYGDAICQTIQDVIWEQNCCDISITVVDRGALDCTIRARFLAALSRAGLKGKKEAV